MILHAIVKEVLEREEFGYDVKRADDDARPGMINDRIIHDIVHADLVVADLTDLNANAFYELGIRHAAQKPTIHIAKLGTPLPFDNAGHDTTFVDVTDWGSITRVRERLAASVTAIRKPGYRVSNPITQANASFELKSSADPKEQVLGDIIGRLANLETSITRSPRKNNLQREFADHSINIISSINKRVADVYRMEADKGDVVKYLFTEAGVFDFDVGDIIFSVDTMSYKLESFNVTIQKNGSRIDLTRAI